MQRTPMRRRAARILHARLVPALVLALLLASQGGAAHQIRRGQNPDALAAAYPHSEPSRGQSADAPYDEECLNCHAPMGCLAANQCSDCHQELARAQACTQEPERAMTEEPAGMPPEAGIYQAAWVEQPEPDDVACDVPLGALNHEQLSGFSLERHETGFDGRPITCESCHPGGLYDSASVACAGCHAEEAPGYMADHAVEHGDGCADCHDGRGGTASQEEAGEVHALGGAHEQAGCQACHTGSTFADEVRACSDCHEEPAVHAGRTGLRCDWCHTAVSWAEAQLMEHDFRLDHGGLGEEGCDACHTGTYESYTCSGCHEHQSAGLQERHAQEGIDELEPCGRCHPTGVGGEAGRLGHGTGGQIGNPGAPEQNPGGQSPAGGHEVAPPSHEGGEQVEPNEPVEGMRGPVEGAAEPAEATAAGQGDSTMAPTDGLEAPGGSSEEPVESMTGSAEGLPVEPAPETPSSSGDGLEPVTQPGSQEAGG